MMTKRDIHCTGCLRDVEARLTDGVEIYPHRSDLAFLPFWRCDDCGNFVGCHHKTADRTRPLGCIPTPQIKYARSQIHRILDPLWKRGKMKRGEVYAAIAAELGIPEYHTGDLRDIDTAREVYRIVVRLRKRHGLTRAMV